MKDPLRTAINYFMDTYKLWDCGRCPMETQCTLEWEGDGSDWKEAHQRCQEEIARGFREDHIEWI